jgi:two-component system nitrogen regulation response regulator GlnG
LESELFGHEKGSFTGADKQKIGKFEQADKGTIFLDEIGEMSYLTQAKMLRIIQDQRFERIGGTVTISTGARIVAATNRDLSQMVLEGKFRGDLVYRLNCLTIRMPPLRDREGDIEQLVDRFIAVHNSRNPTRKWSMHPDSVALLKKYSWPGNVRELQNAVLYSAINSATPVILPESLPLCVS